MLALSQQDILQAAIEVDVLQRELVEAFFAQNPGVTEFGSLTDFPKAGQLQLGGQTWRYRKHGLGYSFLSDQGCVIDAHNHFNRGSRWVDAHRVTEYLLSVRADLGQMDELHTLIEGGLEALEKQGFLARTANSPTGWEIRSEGR